jgi:hypothetical protein
MINIFTTATVTPQASRVRVSALLPVVTGMGASIEGRHMGVDAGFTGVCTQAFPTKDVYLGVRAWSPPI